MSEGHRETLRRFFSESPVGVALFLIAGMAGALISMILGVWFILLAAEIFVWLGLDGIPGPTWMMIGAFVLFMVFLVAGEIDKDRKRATERAQKEWLRRLREIENDRRTTADIDSPLPDDLIAEGMALLDAPGPAAHPQSRC